jgi:DNA-binding MarR family transcriptional regulator
VKRPDYSDPIEWVRHYWRMQDMGDERKFLAMASVLRLYQLMTTELERVLRKFDLNRNSYLLLASLHLSEDGSRVLSRLASHMMVHPTTVTIVTDKLEQQGLLVRTPHPTDRRATYARITPAGKALLKDATSALEEADFGLPGLTVERANKLVSMLTPLRTAAGDVSYHH